jgi:hypothetical protein
VTDGTAEELAKLPIGARFTRLKLLRHLPNPTFPADLIRKTVRLQSLASLNCDPRENPSEEEKVESCQGFATFAGNSLGEATSSHNAEKPSTSVVTVEKRRASPSDITTRICRAFEFRHRKVQLGKRSA